MAGVAGRGQRLWTYLSVRTGRLVESGGAYDDSRGDGHDVVLRVDTSGARPRLTETYLAGKGDITTKNDVTGSTGDRLDYPSVALLRRPDGGELRRLDVSSADNPRPAASRPRGRDPGLTTVGRDPRRARPADRPIRHIRSAAMEPEDRDQVPAGVWGTMGG